MNLRDFAILPVPFVSFFVWVSPQSGPAVWRRYSDFAWLHATVATNNPGVILPRLPDKALVGLSNFFATSLSQAHLFSVPSQGGSERISLKFEDSN